MQERRDVLGKREPTYCTKCDRIITPGFIEGAEAEGLHGTYKWYKIPAWRILGGINAERDKIWRFDETLRNLHPWCQREWKNLHWVYDSLWEIPERRNRDFGLAKWICDIEQLPGKMPNIARVSSFDGRCSYVPPVLGWIWYGVECEARPRVYPSGDDYYLLYQATYGDLQRGNKSPVLKKDKRSDKQGRESIYRAYRDGRRFGESPMRWLERVGWDDGKWHELEDIFWEMEIDCIVD